MRTLDQQLILQNLANATTVLMRHNISYIQTGDGWITCYEHNIQIRSRIDPVYIINIFRSLNEPFEGLHLQFTFEFENIKDLENNILMLTKLL